MIFECTAAPTVPVGEDLNDADVDIVWDGKAAQRRRFADGEDLNTTSVTCVLLAIGCSADGSPSTRISTRRSNVGKLCMPPEHRRIAVGEDLNGIV